MSDNADKKTDSKKVIESKAGQDSLQKKADKASKDPDQKPSGKAAGAVERHVRTIGGMKTGESQTMDEAMAAAADANLMTPAERRLYLIYMGLENMFSAIRRMALVNLALIILLFLSVVTVIILALREPPIAVVYRDENGDMIELASNSDPVVMDVDVVNFSGSRVGYLHTLTPFALEEDMAKNREFFEPKAYQNYLQQMESSGDPRIVRNNRISVAAVTTKGPIITNKIESGGRQVWTLKGEALKTYYDATGDMTPVKILFEMDVVQVPRSVYRPGIRIQRYIILDSRAGN